MHCAQVPVAEGFKGPLALNRCSGCRGEGRVSAPKACPVLHLGATHRALASNLEPACDELSCAWNKRVTPRVPLVDWLVSGFWCTPQQESHRVRQAAKPRPNLRYQGRGGRRRLLTGMRGSQGCVVISQGVGVRLTRAIARGRGGWHCGR